VAKALFLPTIMFIQEPGVPLMRQDRARVIAAPVIKQITIVQIPSTVIGMIPCAIVMTIMHLDVPAAVVMRITPLAQPTSVVPAGAILRPKHVCRRQRRRRAEVVVGMVITQERAAARTQVFALPSLKRGVLCTAGANPRTGGARF
jgi:hypothetical protein